METNKTAVEQSLDVVNAHEDAFLAVLYERLKILQESYLGRPANHLLEEIDEIDIQLTRELHRLRPPREAQ